MTNRPIHENLDTSFVNVSALIRYLRHRHFAGKIDIKLNGYEAEVVFLEGNKLRVSEHDQIAGRIAEGEEALQRLLIRSRDPGGTISVFQFVEETTVKIVEQTEIVATNGNSTKKLVHEVAVLPIITEPSVPKTTFEEFVPKAPSLPNFPFSLSNKVESKAKQLSISTNDWQVLVQLTSEILRTIDSTLASENLDFSAALNKIQVEICEDYPFLNPKSDDFKYTASRILIKNQVNTKIYVASQNEIVRRILDKLRSNKKLSEAYRKSQQQLVALFKERKPLYDRFGITPLLSKTLNL
jgi:hypothetical protein